MPEVGEDQSHVVGVVKTVDFLAVFVLSRAEREDLTSSHASGHEERAPERNDPIGAVDVLATGVRGALDLGELVAYPAHSQHVAGVLGVGLYLLADVAYLHVRRAGVS
jgi:hypothetical protein